MLPLELTFNQVFDRFVVVAGLIVIVVATLRLFKYAGAKNWAEAIGHFIVVFVLFGFLSASPAAVGLLQGLWHLVLGA